MPRDSKDPVAGLPSQIVEVATGVILPQNSSGDPDYSRFLLGKRSGGRAFSGLWEFPGGKIEKGETIERALLRELQEELAIESREFTVVGPLMRLETNAGPRTFILNVMTVIWNNERPLEPLDSHSELAWVDPMQALKMELIPSNYKIIWHLLNKINEQV